MSYRELSFDSHNIAICISGVKDMFRMHLASAAIIFSLDTGIVC